MTNSIEREIAQILLFVEILKPSNLLWKIPCQDEPTDIFEVEWLGSWRYRSLNSDTWIETSLINLIQALKNNDINLQLFRQQLEDYALSSASYAYDIVQEAIRVFGEDTVYEKIENSHEQLIDQVEQMVEEKYAKSILKIITEK